MKTEMKTRILTYLPTLISCLLLAACSQNVHIDRHTSCRPPISPDYTEVTLPPNMAPPCFSLPDSCHASRLRAIYRAGDEETTVTTRNGQIAISPSKWKRLVDAASTITVRLQAQRGDKWEEYAPFHLYIAKEKIDPYIAYRLIEPGYETWNEMGIYQRCLENYEETAILTNKMTGYGCMNCHSFCGQNPEKMLFHLRSDYGGTYIIEEGQIKKLNTKTPQTISALVYPSWHPSGNFVAFSVNDTKQMFHTTDPNRVEVMDYASDVVIYDVKRKQIVSSPLLSSATAFETFPTFSPDGRTLYFCSADSVSIPGKYDQVKYSLCSIGFDADTRSFGSKADTLYNARRAGKSVSFPRVSPDGKFLMFTRIRQLFHLAQGCGPIPRPPAHQPNPPLVGTEQQRRGELPFMEQQQPLGGVQQPTHRRTVYPPLHCLYRRRRESTQALLAAAKGERPLHLPDEIL